MKNVVLAILTFSLSCNTLASNVLTKSLCSSDRSEPHYLKKTALDSENIKVEICALKTNECSQIGERKVYNSSALKQAISSMKSADADFIMTVYVDTAAVLAGILSLGTGQLYITAAAGAGIAASSKLLYDSHQKSKHVNSVIELDYDSNSSDENNCNITKFPDRVEVTARHLGVMMDEIMNASETTRSLR